MTILCPAEFAEATRFAVGADEALEAAIYHAGDAERRKALEARRGQASKSLLQCFGSRANSDDIDNKNPFFPDGSEVLYDDGTKRTILDLGKYMRPLRETFVFKDMAQHSFFFREEYIDPDTRKRVDVYDRCWYIFRDGTTQEEADTLSDEELEQKLRESNGNVERTYCPETVQAIESAGENVPFVETMKKRVGMCGGIIYHADHDEDGKPLPYGSWSTHT